MTERYPLNQVTENILRLKKTAWSRDDLKLLEAWNNGSQYLRCLQHLFETIILLLN